jgi:hypothetical protein
VESVGLSRGTGLQCTIILVTFVNFMAHHEVAQLKRFYLLSELYPASSISIDIAPTSCRYLNFFTEVKNVVENQGWWNQHSTIEKWAARCRTYCNYWLCRTVCTGSRQYRGIMEPHPSRQIIYDYSSREQIVTEWTLASQLRNMADLYVNVLCLLEVLA